MYKKIVIIGGGIHGVAAFLNMPHNQKMSAVIVDKFPTPLFHFFLRCNNIGMKYLRSPGTHTLIDPPSFSLAQYNHNIFKRKNAFQGRYYHPSLSLFKNYINHVIYSEMSSHHWIQATITKMSRSPSNTWLLHLHNGKILEAIYVILALGVDTPYLPSPFNLNIPIHKHVLHSKFKRPENTPRKKIAIIGAGMTGCQFALSIVPYHEVIIISRKQLKVTTFDSNPCFIGPKCAPYFENADLETKLEILKKERYSGTINEYVKKEVEQYYKENKLSIIVSEAVAIDINNNTYIIHFKDGTYLEVDDYYFATGLKEPANNLLNNYFLSSLITENSLPVNKYNAPILKKGSVEWDTHLYVSGYLGELSIGPPANNFIGAQLFARKMKNIWSTF